MKIAVINGSPKGKYSITLQTVRYLEKKYPTHTFEVLNAGQTIKALEKDFSKARELLESAEAVLFSYPVYTFIAPCQLHRFIELCKENKVDLSGKIATQITTSKHFYDVTAHRYVEENCYDMGMKVVKGLSADMDDLLTEKGRGDAEKFFEHFLFCCEKELFEKPVIRNTEYTVCHAEPCEDTAKSEIKDVVIITDEKNENSNLSKMIARFQAKLPYKTRIVNISDYPLSGGCLGCFNCAVSGKCVYKDNFDEFLRNDIQKADAIVYAFTVRDHSMGSRFKMYDDRNFCNGHRTVTVGMPIGYLVSGAYSQEPNLQMVVEGRAEVGGNPLMGVATDEVNTNSEIDALCEKLSYALENKYTSPSNFLGVGGMKIFRDLIYQMRGMMRADHKFFKSHGQYDFPHKKKMLTMKMYLVGMLLSSEKIRKKMGNKMNDGMLMPYNKMFEKMEKQKTTKLKNEP